jgi:hypothetical protein
LNKKGNRLLLAGKYTIKVKAACAREMVGFVWESLDKVVVLRVNRVEWQKENGQVRMFDISDSEQQWAE